MAKYINPYTDFGFKKLFGEEGNKALLVDFLNQLLPTHHQIKDLTFLNVEALPDSSEERKAFGVAEVANFTKQQREDYEKSRLSYIGLKELTTTAKEEGFEQGIEQGKSEMVIEMEKEGFSFDQIAKIAKISVSKVQQIIEVYKTK
jgi:flagellar biosynthesis/type III secretory pathway protein FliH